MSDMERFPGQQGHAWRGDWQRRVKDLLTARGYSAVRGFLASFPTKALVDLAEEIGPGDVAGVQLQWMALDEAKAANQVEQLARDLLVRTLHKSLPDGWPSPTSNVRDMLAVALSGWTSSITSRERQYRPCMLAIANAMLDERPFHEGWLPASFDDPTLVGFFEKHWSEP